MYCLCNHSYLNVRENRLTIINDEDETFRYVTYVANPSGTLGVQVQRGSIVGGQSDDLLIPEDKDIIIQISVPGWLDPCEYDHRIDQRRRVLTVSYLMNYCRGRYPSPRLLLPFI